MKRPRKPSLRIGARIRLDYGVGNINNRTLHVRGRVDDYIVCRRWKGARWRYELLHIDFFEYAKDYIR